MRPQTHAQVASALRDASHYATDSETLWLMQEAGRRLDAIDAPAPASAAASAESPEEQNAPAAAEAKPQRLPRAPKKAAE